MTQDYSELLKRLDGGFFWPECRNDAATAIRALVAENERLRLALQPFARADRAIGNEPGPFRFETGTGHRLIERDDLRNARAALGETK
jgi:hypothetical protein